MTRITIPPAALEAGATVINDYGVTPMSNEDLARAAFEAMVGAWPGLQRVKGYFTHDTDYYEPALILPLTEKTDDMA